MLRFYQTSIVASTMIKDLSLLQCWETAKKGSAASRILRDYQTRIFHVYNGEGLPNRDLSLV